MKNKKRKFKSIINHFAIKKQFQFTHKAKNICKKTVTLLEGNNYVIKKTQIPKKSGNGTVVLLDVGHTDLTRPAYTDKSASMLGILHGAHPQLPNNSTSLRNFIQMGKSFILSNLQQFQAQMIELSFTLYGCL